MQARILMRENDYGYRSLLMVLKSGNGKQNIFEQHHEISNNVVYGTMCDQQSLRSAYTYVQSVQSLCLSLEYSMSDKLLTEHHLEFLSLKGGCKGSSMSTLVKKPHCCKSPVTAHF